MAVICRSYLFKVKMKLAPDIINEVLDTIECPYPLRNELTLKSRNIRTIWYGIETAVYMPSELKKSTSLNKYISKIKAQTLENCPCKLCKIYLQRIGQLQVANQYLLIDTVIYNFFICFSICFAGFFSVCSCFCFVFWGFFDVVVFCFAFLLFSFTPQFRVDLNYPHIPDKGNICSLICFLLICNSYWSTINR